MRKIIINYETRNIPAPFAHQYQLDIELKDKIKASYEVRYLGRDEISEEEILEEGFSLNDDFTWEGEIDPSWREVILSLADEPQENAKKEPNEFTQTIVRISSKSDEGEKSRNFYDNDDIEYQIQEIVQALFENSGRELPLKVRFFQKSKGSQSEYEVTVSFAKRESTLIKNNSEKSTLSWEDTRSFMSLIYQPDYLLDSTKLKKNGLYISFEENYWYSIEEIEENEKLSGFKQAILNFLE